MTWVETTIAVTNAANTITKEHQKGFIQYCLVSFFNAKYKKYLTRSILVQAESQFEAKQEIIEKFSSQPTPALQLMESEWEVDYKNMAWVLMKAADKIDENAEWNIDPDKIKRLKDLSKEFSSEEMQDYVAWVISWEYNKSWTYSLQAIEIIRSLSKSEFQILKKYKGLLIEQAYMFSSCIWSWESIQKLWVSLDEFHLLVSLWIFSSQSITTTFPDYKSYSGYKINIWLRQIITTYEWEKRISWLYSLTNAWKEIMTLVEEEFSSIFFEYNEEELLKLWVKNNENNNILQKINR